MRAGEVTMTSKFFEGAVQQNSPIRVLVDFLKEEESKTSAGTYDALRFVGYVLDIGYDTVTIITSDPFKMAVGGVPRNSLLIMVPSELPYGMDPHLTLLRVLDVAPTPLSSDIQQTYFELQKRSMPEIDVFTQAELQWGALKTTVLGMLYVSPDEAAKLEFSGDLNNIVSAHKYRVYAPDDKLLDLVVNATVPEQNRFSLGNLRLTESRLPLPGKPMPNVPVQLSTDDFMATRTAMFGKTRMGKSNIVKLIAQSVLETTRPGTETGYSCGQLIFDVDGEYSNDNPQDGSLSIASAYKDRTAIYALNAKTGTESKPLKLDFYAHPDQGHKILAQLLTADGRNTIYINSFKSAQIPGLDELETLPFNERLRGKRRVLMLWAVLSKANFPVDESKLRGLVRGGFNPQFRDELRLQMYGQGPPDPPSDLNSLRAELERLIVFQRANASSAELKSSGSGTPLFDQDDLALLNFFSPTAGAGPSLIQPYRMYHDVKAEDFVEEIKALLEAGMTVILDLSNANPEVVRFFSIELTRGVFSAQVQKFTNNALGAHYVQLFFEEAHTLFPSRNQDTEETYSRLAKEGAKYHIGMVYSTQSPSTLDHDLLSQTENFFVVHLSSEDEVNALARVNVAYKGLGDDLMRTRTVGYVRMLTRSNRFVVPLQASKFTISEES